MPKTEKTIEQLLSETSSLMQCLEIAIDREKPLYLDQITQNLEKIVSMRNVLVEQTQIRTFYVATQNDQKPAPSDKQIPNAIEIALTDLASINMQIEDLQAQVQKHLQLLTEQPKQKKNNPTAPTLDKSQPLDIKHQPETKPTIAAPIDIQRLSSSESAISQDLALVIEKLTQATIHECKELNVSNCLSIIKQNLDSLEKHGHYKKDYYFSNLETASLNLLTLINSAVNKQYMNEERTTSLKLRSELILLSDQFIKCLLNKYLRIPNYHIIPMVDLFSVVRDCAFFLPVKEFSLAELTRLIKPTLEVYEQIKSSSASTAAPATTSTYPGLFSERSQSQRDVAEIPEKDGPSPSLGS